MAHSVTLARHPAEEQPRTDKPSCTTSGAIGWPINGTNRGPNSPVNDIKPAPPSAFMKPSTAVLYVMVTISLVFSIAAFALFAQSSGIFNPRTSPTPSPVTPSPTIYYPPTIQPTTPPNTHLTINYVESNRVENNGRATVTLTVTATYESGDQITLNYSQFYLQLYTPRMVLYLYEGTINYPNHGTVTLGASNPTQTFHLTYEFGTDGFNGMDPAPIVYQLQCNSSATIDWPNQTYH